MMYLVENHLGGCYFSTLPKDAIEKKCEQCGDSDYIIAEIDDKKDISPEDLKDFAKKTIEFLSFGDGRISFAENWAINEIVDEAKIIGDGFARSVAIALNIANNVDIYDMTENFITAFEDYDTEVMREAYVKAVIKEMKNGKFMLVGVE